MSRILGKNIYCVLYDRCVDTIATDLKKSYYRHKITFSISSSLLVNDTPYDIKLETKKNYRGRILLYWSNFYEVCRKTNSNPVAVRCELNYVDLYYIDDPCGEHILVLYPETSIQDIQRVLSTF